MDCRLRVIVLCLSILVTTCQGSPTHVIEDIPVYQNVTEGVSDSIMKELILKSIKELSNKFIHNVYELLEQVKEEKESYLMKISEEEISNSIRQIDTPLCNGQQRYEQLIHYFSYRYVLLEFPIRAAIIELEDKISEMKSSSTLCRSIVDLKVTTCELMGNQGHCKDISDHQVPCLNDLYEQFNESQYFDTGSLAFLNTKFIEKPHREITSRNRKRLVPSKPLSTDCGNDQFKCQTSEHCIPLEDVCDGEFDCRDESDESPACLNDCSGKRCRNLICINETQICDGEDDCGDGTDEENCIQAGPIEPGTLDNCYLKDANFLCTDRSLCLSVNSVCDGKPDCSDSSDEGRNCSVTSGCDRCAALGGVCLRYPAGPLCISQCPSGFVLDLESGICVLSDSMDGKRVIYKSNSFFGNLNKIHVLFKRLRNGLVLLKKYTDNKIFEIFETVDKCINNCDTDSLVILF